MKHPIGMIVILLVMVAGLALPAMSFANESIVYTLEPVTVFGSEDEINESFSVVMRNDEEAAMMLHTSDLTPDEAVTVWWVVFNNPSACSDGICASDDLPQNGGDLAVEAAMIFADGQIVDAFGNAEFTSRLALGDTSNAYAFETNGLTDLENAEIHLVVRTHGEALDDADLLEAQLTTLNGGCENGSEASDPPNPNTCTNIQSSIHIAG